MITAYNKTPPSIIMIIIARSYDVLKTKWFQIATS